MKNSFIKLAIVFIALFGLLLATNALAVDKVLLGHPACLSGKLAKCGSQASWGIKACVNGLMM